MLPRANIMEEAREPIPPLLQVMKYEVPLVLVLLPLKYQGNTKSIFHENPAPLWCLIAATSGYWLIVGIIKETASFSCEWINTLRRAALATALLSAISFVCIFIPYPLSLVPLAIVITSLVSLALLYAFSLFIRGVVEWVVNMMHGVIVWARRGSILPITAGNVSTTEEAVLPSEGEGEGGGNILMEEVSSQV